MKKILIFLLVLFLVFILGFFFLQYKLTFFPVSEKHQNYKEIPQNIKSFALEIEDKRFYGHFGADFLALARALKEDIKAGKIKQGGSTIDQQAVKISLQNYKDRGISSKLKEIFLAINLNFHYKKEDILKYWVNNVEFLNGVIGFRSACKVYFNKDCKKLFDSELLFLFATYQTGKNPFKNFNLIKSRSLVLCKSLEKEKITNCDNWKNLPPKIKQDLKFEVSKINNFKIFQKENPIKVKQNLQYFNKIEKILENTQNFRKNMGFEDCCVLVMDKTGKVLSMNVCRKIEDKQGGWVNACLRKRQTGSAIKPFLYLQAIEEFGYSKDTILYDEPVEFVLDGEEKYIPRNFDMKYHGKVSLAQALGNSLNVPAVKILEKITPEKFLDFLTNLRLALGDNEKQVLQDKQKFPADKLGLSMALGTYEMSVLEFANLWRVFLTGDIEGFKNDTKGLINVSKISINLLISILSDNKNRLISFGLENNLDVLGWAVKTGTSRGFVDGRTCGVNKEKELVLCVWAGNYNGISMKGSGTQTAGYLWNLATNIMR